MDQFVLLIHKKEIGRNEGFDPDTSRSQPNRAISALTDQSSSLSMSRTAARIASDRFGYLLDRTRSSNPSTKSSGRCTETNRIIVWLPQIFVGCLWYKLGYSEDNTI